MNPDVEHIEAKREVIAHVNSQLTNLGLPAYTEIFALLLQAAHDAPLDTEKRGDWLAQASAAFTEVPALQYRVMNADGRYYSKVGCPEIWVTSENDADAMERHLAEDLARIEKASIVLVI
jgi:hypothetical protein